MKVTLLDTSERALDILLFTKQTRLDQSPGTLEEIAAWPLDKKMAELDYMRDTIQSSWEFVDYIFCLEGVSRAFTHQLVRSRHNSFAQQSQRAVDMSGFEFVWPDGVPEGCGTGAHDYMQSVIDDLKKDYEYLVHDDVDKIPIQAARAILPTNVATNITVKASLRSLADTAKIRLCYRTQGEYQRIFREMRKEVIAVHPWAEPFIRVACAATGVCAFPNYHECPIKGGVFNADTGLRWDDDPLNSAQFRQLPRTREQQQMVWERQAMVEADPSRRA